MGTVRALAGPVADLSPALAAEEAQHLVVRIGMKLETGVGSLEQAADLIKQAQADEIHVVLGYRSWPELVADKFGEQLSRLARLDRGPLIEMLSSAGMSTRGIEAATGVSKSSVDRHLSRGGTPDPMVEATDEEFETAISGAPADGDLSRENVEKQTSSKIVTGRDGKQYGHPEKREPRKPRSSPLPDRYWRAVYDLEKAVARVQRLHAADRFEANREALHDRNWRTVSNAASVLMAVETDLAGTNDCRDCGRRMLPSGELEPSCPQGCDGGESA